MSRLLRRGLLAGAVIVRDAIIVGTNGTGNNTEKYGFLEGSFGAIGDNAWVGTPLRIAEITSRNFNSGTTAIRADTSGTKYDNKDSLILQIWSSELSTATLLAQDSVAWADGAGYYTENSQTDLKNALANNIGERLGYELL